MSGKCASSQPMDICIIGAGPVGICAGHHLSKYSDWCSFTIYEQTGFIGGTWVYTDHIGVDNHGQSIHSSVYKSLKTNTPFSALEYSDFRPPDHLSSRFVRHEDVHDYLVSYAYHFEVHRYIKFYHRIEYIKRENGQWHVTIEDILSNTKFSKTFDAIFVCSGHYSDPRCPDIDGSSEFEGRIMHSHDYKYPEPFANERVVVIGAGASGIDISLEIATVASQVYLCHRENLQFSDFPDHIKVINQPIEKFTKNSVIFKDGQVVEDVTTIVFATGYYFNIKFLDPSCGLTISDDNYRINGLYKYVVNTTYPTMGLFGFLFRTITIPLFELQVLFFISILCQETELPSKEEMDLDTERDLEMKLSKGLQKRHAHYLVPDIMCDYIDQLSGMARVHPIRPVVLKIWKDVSYIRKKHSHGYRHLIYEVKNDHEYVKIGSLPVQPIV